MQKMNNKLGIQNIVVTRFSLRVAGWRHQIYFDERGRDAWFEYRAMLYKRTLGESLSVQTVKPAKVYLLMDTGDRALAARHFPEMNFMPIFSLHGDYRRQIAADLERQGLVDNIAMSRIDSDDIIARNYFEKLNACILDSLRSGEPSELFVACKGYRTNFVDVQPMYYHNGPFITRFCSKYAGETPYFQHETLGQHAHVKDASAEWMQVIHGTNLANGFQPSNETSLDAFLEGRQGSGVLSRRLIDPAWFKEWAGFLLPSASIFDEEPVYTMRSRIRRLWRKLRGRM